MLTPKIVSRLTSYVSLTLFAIFAAAVPGHAAPDVISTVAGDGSAAYSGDGGLATSASLNYPNGVAVDSAGNIYIADSTNHRIRKVDKLSGTITTTAGNGTPGYSGNGGPATSASLNYPYGVAVDSTGNIYIVDLGNSRIRRVDKLSGNITTVAGNGTPGYSGDGGPATSASLFNPYGVAVDALGNIYVADFTNNRVRKVDKLSGNITTVAGNGTAAYSGDDGLAASAGLAGPRDVAVDSTGNIYIADSSSHRIRRVDTNGVISTVAGNGTPIFSGDGGFAISASLYFPYGVVLDSLGNIYIAESGSQRIRKVDTNGVITTIAGNGTPGYSGDTGTATSAMLNNPRGIAVDSTGNIYIADTTNSRIRKVEAGVSVSTYTVTYTSNGGSSVTSQSVAYNTATTAPAPPIKTGYTFAGWYSDVGLTAAFAFTTAITGDTTLYAKWTAGSPLGNCTSTNATVAYCEVTNIPAGQSGNFTPKHAVSIGLTGVTGSADICITFNNPPSNPVLMKFVNGAWGKIYPGNPQWSGISNVSYGNEQICFTLQDNSDADGDNTLGTIADPVVIGDAVAQLVISKSGSGAGTVASVPEGINCGSACSAPFDSGLWVTLTATPDMGSVFSGWLGEGCSGRGTCTVAMDAAKAVTAIFSKLGDVDGNGKVEMQDTIFALQVVSGRTPASPINPQGDVDGDQKIGLPEAIFGIQYIAELRNNDQRAKAGSITIVKDAQPNDAQGFTFTGNQHAIMPFLLDDDGNNTNTLSNQKGFYLAPGSYTFTETPVNGWSLASILCKPSGSTSTDITTGTATISLATGDNVTCTFTNTKQTTETGSICGIKFNDFNGNGLQDPGELGIPNWQISLGLAAIPGVTTDAKGAYCFHNVPAGTYTVSETVQAPWQQTFPPAPGTHTVTLTAGQQIDGLNFGNKIPTDSCSNYLCNGDFENEQIVSVGSQGFFNQSLISCWNTTEADGLIEVWGSGFGGVTAYSGNQFIELNARMGATLNQNFTAIPGSTVTISFAHRGRAGFPNQMTVSIGPAGGTTPFPLGTFVASTTAWTLDSVTYAFPNNGVTAYVLNFTSDDTGAGGNFLDAINVACQAAIVGSLTIVKDAVPNDAQDFAFYSFGPNSGSIMPFLLDDDAGAVGDDNLLSNTKTFANLAPGSYSVTEDFFNPVPVTGWDLTGIVCLPAGSATVDLANRAFTVNLTAGANVTCTFTNTKQQPAGTGTLTIVKDAVPNDAQDFAFYSFGPNSGSIMPFLLDDDAGAVGADNLLSNTKTFANLAPGSYSVTEDFFNPVPVTGWDLTGIVCLPAGSAAVDLANRAFTVDLTAGDNVTCTFTNVKAPKAADLAITKTSVVSGQDITYTITVTNLGTTPPTDTIHLLDTLSNFPAGTIYNFGSGVGSCTTPVPGQPWDCIIPPENIGQPLTIGIVVPAGGGSVTNCAQVSLAGETNLLNNQACVTNIVPAAPTPADLAITKTGVVSGQNVTYTITITNLGTTPPMDTIHLVDTLSNFPAGTIYNFGSGVGSCTTPVPGQAWDCEVPLANLGQPLTIGIVVPAGGGSVTNCAQVTLAGETNLLNNQACVTNIVPAVATPADLAITKTGVVSGQNVTYTITITNLGTTPPMDTIHLVDTLSNFPAGTIYNFGSGVGPCTIPVPGQPWDCEVPTVNLGQPLTIGIVVPAGGGSVTNCVQVSLAGETNLLNNQACVTNVVPAVATPADLSITKTGVVTGQKITYTITIANLGTTPPADTIHLVDTLSNFPAGTIYDFGSGVGPCTIPVPGQPWDCEVPTVNLGQPLTIGIVVPAGGGSVTNCAQVSLAGETNLLNNQACVTNIVPAAPTPPDLSITKTGVVSGQDITYTITITNNGTTAPTEPIHLSDLLTPFPAGTYYNFASGVGSCTAPVPGQPWDCVIPPENLGQPITIGIVIPAGGGTVTNCATVTLAGEANTLNNQACVTNIVPAAPTAPDLSVTKVCAVNGPQSVLCTVTVTNNGSAPSVSPITLTDILTGAPTDALYTGAGGTLPISCSPGAGPITPIACIANTTLAPGESQYALFSFSLPQGGTFTNCATVLQGNVATQPESNNANNTNICTTITVPPPVTAAAPDLSITKTSMASYQGITYTITVTNNGTVPTANPVVVTDTVVVAPANSVFNFNGYGTACSVAGANTATCTSASPLAANGGTVTFSFGFFVPANGSGSWSGSVTNCATLPADSDLSNNQSCVTDTVGTAPVTGTITIVKDAVPDDPQDFEFIVNNYLYTYLDDDNDDVRSNQHLFSSFAAGSYTLTETQVTGWDLTGISCTPSAGTAVDLANRTVTVNLAGGDNVTCTFTNAKQPDNLTFTAVNGPTLQVSTQAMIPTVLMTPTAFTSTTTSSVTTATVTAGPAGVPNDGIFTLVAPYSDSLVGAVATLPSSILLGSGPLAMTSTSLGSSVGLVSADFGEWAIRDAVTPPLPANSVITYIAFAGGTQLTTTLPTGTATYTGKMTGVLANTPIGGSDDVSGNVILNFDFTAGTINGSLSGISGIVTTQGVSTITPCVYPLSAPACTYAAYAPPANVPFNDITLSNGTIAGNSFSATIATPAITGATTMTMTGNFYGTTANEVAGTFTISVPSPGMILIGSFGANL